MMKKTLLVFLLSLVVFAGAAFFVYEDAVNAMINIGGNYFDQLLGNTPDVPDSSKPGDKPEEPEKHYDVLITEEETSYRLEAEDLSIENLVPDDAGAVEIEVWPHVTGLGHIAPGGYQTFTIKSDKDAIVSLSLSFANASGGSILQYIPGALMNGKQMRFLDAEVPKGTGTAKNPETYYWNLATLKIAEFNVEANVDYEIKMFINMGNLDAYIFDVLSEHVHMEEVVEGYDATCTEAGLTDGKKCLICGEVTVAQEEIPAKGHTDVITPGYDATCTETGLTEGKKCSVCGESVPQEVIPAKGHKDEAPQDGKCDVCNISICVNHNEVIDAAVEATCTTDGKTEGKHCSVCGEVIVAQEVVKAEGHAYDDDLDANCNKCGEKREFKLATPDNSDDKLFYRANATYIEIDRAVDENGDRVSMFGLGTDYVVVYVYESADADKDDYVAQFKLYGYADHSNDGAINTSITSMDDSISKKIIRGSDGNLYIHKAEFNVFYDFLRDIIGYNYSYGQTYYFAAQAVAAEGTAYESSDISAIGANGIVRDASKGTDKYTVTVQNGTIDGELTTVTAGYGVAVNVVANAFENDEFAAWKLVTVGEDGTETVGEVYSDSETFTLTVTSSLTIRAVGKSETQKVKLATPDDSNNQMITFVVSGSNFYIEFDRQKNADGSADTVFDEGVAYVRYYMYRDITNEAGETEKQLVSHFDITSDGYVINYNGEKCPQRLEGEPGNFYSKMKDGTIHNWIKASYVQGAQAKGLDITEWSASETHYFACQVISSNPDLYEDSDIGAMGKGHGSI